MRAYVPLFEKVRAVTQRAHLSLCHLLNTAKCCNRSRGKEMFRFEKPGAYTQTLKSEGNSAVRLENRGSGAIAPSTNFSGTMHMCRMHFRMH
jgi:hypothetical protein